jgi:hypothetical protein
LDDFPEEYKTSIVFTLYIPGHDTSNLPKDIDPIDTFPIVFNYLFDDNISFKSVPTPIIDEGDGKDLP